MQTTVAFFYSVLVKPNNRGQLEDIQTYNSIAFVSAFIDADEIMFGVWQVLYANSAIDSFLISVMH
jgi:hypothetical protein